MNRLVALLVAGGVLVVTALSAFFTVHQTQQVLITQFGKPIRMVTEPGLHAKVPFIQSVIPFDRRLLDLEGRAEEVILGDQRRLIVDSFTRFRITNPLRFYQTVGPVPTGIRAQLGPIVASTLRNVLGNEPLPAVLSNDRARIMGEIRRQVNDATQRFGLDVVDVRIRRADLPEQNTEAILSRMQSERERVAREQRAIGAQEAVQIRANADRERTVLLAEAHARADILRGQGEQEAIRIFADAFQRDPNFFQFWRTMQAYREAFGEGETRMVLTPDSEFFRFFRDSTPGPLESSPGGSGAGANGARPAAAAPAPAPSPAAPPAPAEAPAAAAAPQ